VKSLNFITGKQAIQAYGIGEFKIFDLVKNHALQPYSEIGEPIEAPFRPEIENRLEIQRQLKNRRAFLYHSGKSKSEEYLSKGSELRSIDNELRDLDYENASRSWSYIQIPRSATEKGVLLLRLLSYFYKPEDIEAIIGKPITGLPTPDEGSVATVEQAPFETKDLEPLPVGESRRYGLLKRQMERHGDVLRAAVYATWYCVQQEKPLTRDQLFDEIDRKFKGLAKKDNEAIRAAILEFAPHLLRGSGRDRKSKDDSEEDE
jgi:hypothetical protein